MQFSKVSESQAQKDRVRVAVTNIDRRTRWEGRLRNHGCSGQGNPRKKQHQ